jgi:hypothetical protein
MSNNKRDERARENALKNAASAIAKGGWLVRARLSPEQAAMLHRISTDATEVGAPES